ncbi:relaxase/mobilization nuclease domain-containing protein [Intestinibacillus sp. Marseille-P6563]|uniref:relaxase/mobilization nuclease domain-containing protein n=1 Tax=Intestinibacillus sp. Marseille-P6563 TaxID=2364792 RepID=UPI000F049D9B|nr:relaxase/mobilization nuclease domain-containing protein [Intestinibacillus sp. Marseille-P6563]
MAVIKAVSSHAPINTVINYVCKKEKTERKLMTGIGCSPESAADEMQTTKLLYHKTGGRTYKHFVQSFASGENVTAEIAHELAVKFAEQCPLFQGFEVLAVTHQDRNHFHTHFVVNSVSYIDGHKFQMKSTELQDMKNLSDSLCRQYGLSICRKGYSFDGREREDTTSYHKETYQLLKQAESGEIQSYVQNIALAIMACREIAISRKDFIQKLSSKGVDVEWSDSRKYITFIDIDRQEHGETKYKIRNNKLEKYYHIDFSKAGLEHEFEVNARNAETAKSAAEQLKHRIDRGSDASDYRIRTDHCRTEWKTVQHKHHITGERTPPDPEQTTARQPSRNSKKSQEYER